MKRAILLILACLAGCTAYRAAPLPDTAPAAAPLPVTDLTPMRIAVLAVRRDPDLRAVRARAGIARAQLLAAGTPPDPTLSLGVEALLGGPASMSAIAGSLTEAIPPLFTRSAVQSAARAHLQQVNAEILWQEWQVAAQAEQLAVALTGEAAQLVSLRGDARALRALDRDVRAQTAAGNLTRQDAAGTESARAALRIALDAQEQARARDRARLAALLALPPGTPIAPRPFDPPVIPAARLHQALATLARRRPDLLALRFGYQAADARLRAAILARFLPIGLGAQGGRDTSGVTTAGPRITLSLPLFNRGRPAIATAQATRAALRARYVAALTDAQSAAEALWQRIALLRGQIPRADRAAQDAAASAAAARRAFAAGGLDLRTETDFIVAAGHRHRQALRLRTELRTAQISLAVLLGVGLPLPG